MGTTVKRNRHSLAASTRRKMSSPGERRLWMPAEDQQLKDAVERSYQQFGRLDWTSIAEQVPGRDRKACRKRWHQPTCANVNMGRWTTEEDERLLRGVNQFGSHSWTRVAEIVETRNGDQCLKRWTNYLNPTIQHSAWTEQEDRVLIMAVQQSGRDWARISSLHFPHRSPLSLRHRDQLLRNRALSANSRGSTPENSARSDRLSVPSQVTNRRLSLNDAYVLATQAPGPVSRSPSVQSVPTQMPRPLSSVQAHDAHTGLEQLQGFSFGAPDPSNIQHHPFHQMPMTTQGMSPVGARPQAPGTEQIPWEFYGQEPWWTWLDHEAPDPSGGSGGHTNPGYPPR